MMVRQMVARKYVMNMLKKIAGLKLYTRKMVEFLLQEIVLWILLHGGYITFVDSDDYLEKDAVNNLYNTLIENDADFSTCNTIDFVEENFPNESNMSFKSEKRDLSSTYEIMKSFYRNTYFTCVTWAKLYKAELAKSERFNININYAEDYDYLNKVLKKCNKGAVDNSLVVYYYRNREDSLAHSQKKFFLKLEKEIDLYKSNIENVKNNMPEVTSDAVYRLQHYTLRYITYCIKGNYKNSNIEEYIELIYSYPIELKGKNYIKLINYKYFPMLFKLYYNIRVKKS